MITQTVEVCPTCREEMTIVHNGDARTPDAPCACGRRIVELEDMFNLAIKDVDKLLDELTACRIKVQNMYEHGEEVAAARIAELEAENDNLRVDNQVLENRVADLEDTIADLEETVANCMCGSEDFR